MAKSNRHILVLAKKGKEKVAGPKRKTRFPHCGMKATGSQIAPNGPIPYFRSTYMSKVQENTVRIAILDLYEGHPNQGMRCLREIIRNYAEANQRNIQVEEFEVRRGLSIPETAEFDAFISTGGPGSPTDSLGSEWENKYFDWIDSVDTWNRDQGIPKKIFFICHSFQMACRFFNTGLVCKRKSTSFGVFPVHMLEPGSYETVFQGLNDPFYAVDSRDFQVICPNLEKLEELGGKVLSIEKERPHVPYDRAVMAMRFNEHFIGTQFHPEADPIGMSLHLQDPERKKKVIQEHGEEKWAGMLEHLLDPDKIVNTYNRIFPNFLDNVVKGLPI